MVIGNGGAGKSLLLNLLIDEPVFKVDESATATTISTMAIEKGIKYGQD